MRQRPASPHRRKRAVWADHVTLPKSKMPEANPALLTGHDLDIAVAKALGYHVEKHAARYGPGYWLAEPNQHADLDGWPVESESAAWEHVPAFSTDLYYLRVMSDWLLRQRCGVQLTRLDGGWYCTVSPWGDSPFWPGALVKTLSPNLPEVVSRAVVELAGLRETKGRNID